ncbi:MAG: hypothetical protein AAB425_11565 [Bdellovibrionota bacterium]
MDPIEWFVGHGRFFDPFVKGVKIVLVPDFNSLPPDLAAIAVKIDGDADTAFFAAP